MSLVYANALLIVLVLIELWVVHRFKKEKIPWKEIVFNLNSGHILMWLLRGGEIAAFHFCVSYFSLGIVDGWNYYFLWFFAFVAWDFCFYWLHRFHHEISLFWAVHIIHHEGEHFSLSLGIRNSWYSSLSSFPFFIILALFGIPVEIFIATSSIHYLIQFYNHNSLVKHSGFLEKIMVTPAHHRVHHGKNLQYVDKNYGGTFIFWDKMFGSYQELIKNVPIQYGVKDYKESHNIIFANNIPFIKLFGLKFTKPKKTRRSFNLNDKVIAFSGVLLFGLLLVYISNENIWSFNQKAQFFALVFLGTIAVGGLSDGKKWGLILWLFLFCFGSWGFLMSNQISQPIIYILFSILAFHSLIVAYKVYISDKQS